jgi:hypothetical protein
MTMIKANIKNAGTVVRTVECDVVMHTTVEQATKMWGNDVVLNLIVDSATIAAQSTMRGLGDPERKKGRLSDAEITKAMMEWKPGARNVERDPVARANKMIGKLSSEAKAAMLKLLMDEKPTLVKKGKAA